MTGRRTYPTWSRSVVADPFKNTAVLRQLLHYRFSALQAYTRQPSLAERMREAMSIPPVVRANEA